MLASQKQSFSAIWNSYNSADPTADSIFPLVWHDDAVGKVFRYHKLKPRHSELRARIWELRDFDTLARAVAELALGQCAHVEKLLRSTGALQSSGADYGTDAAIRILTVPQGQDPWHRDGWVFQLISWIAAVEESNGVIRIPQMDQASKGFDGLKLEFAPGTQEVARAVVFEDKATGSPRDTVRDKVWPEFLDIAAGNRHPALAAEIGSLLRNYDDSAVQSTVNRIMRDPEGIAFRVSVTAGPYHARSARFNGLFDGYETSVPGRRRLRRGNVFEVVDLRTWMDKLCNAAIQLLENDRV